MLQHITHGMSVKYHVAPSHATFLIFMSGHIYFLKCFLLNYYLSLEIDEYQKKKNQLYFCD